jgi:hypothetical protein
VSTYEFNVAKAWDPDRSDLWAVRLPHQCDAWSITGPSCYDDEVPHAVAVQRLELFIAEAKDALTALRERRETE